MFPSGLFSQEANPIPDSDLQLPCLSAAPVVPAALSLQALNSQPLALSYSPWVALKSDVGQGGK